MNGITVFEISLTEKQVVTLLLYAQNYSLPKIADKMGVSLSTIRERIQALRRNHQREFNNALGIRGVYKRTRDAIRDTTLFSNITDPDKKENLGSIDERVQEKF